VAGGERVLKDPRREKRDTPNVALWRRLEEIVPAVGPGSGLTELGVSAVELSLKQRGKAGGFLSKG